jgi:carboxypeptidase Taq
MRIKNKKIQKLLDWYKEISLLGKTNALLNWDMNVNLPPKGTEGRAQQGAYITKLIVEKWLDDTFRELVEGLSKNDTDLDEEEKAILKNLNYIGRYYWKVPKEIIVEASETTSKAFMVWQYAKRDNKFSDLLPYLKKVVEIEKIIAKHLGYKENPYDALLDLYEPGLTAKECQKIFGKLQPELTKILGKIISSEKYKARVDLVAGTRRYQADDQRQLALFVLRKMNYDMDAGRMDTSSHPFTDALGRFDVRITNRYDETDFRGSFTAGMHEAGHALYEQGVDETYTGTPLGGGVSLGIHESQSRFWENQIGRSWEFMKFVTPIFHAIFPEQLGRVGTDELFTAFNHVQPSLIRVEADEVTYNLHIALRFEIENALVNGKIEAEDLPEVWNKKMKKYLGITPKTDREGVLQDIHWSNGSFGYFPTYTLGNLYAAQFARKLRKDLPVQGKTTVEECAEKGELGPILSWLRTNIHQYGSLYWPRELCRKVTKEELNPKYFLDYIKNKYSRVYKVKLN